jgi:DNA-binding NtrC family response regulator
MKLNSEIALPGIADTRKSGPTHDLSVSGRILLLEDDRILAGHVRDALRSAGFRSRMTGTVRAALQALAEEPPDLLLTDFHLPDGTAFDVLDKIAQIGPSCRVIVMSAADEAELQPLNGYSMVVQLLRKPVEMKCIMGAVHRHVRTTPYHSHHANRRVGLQERLRLLDVAADAD